MCLRSAVARARAHSIKLHSLWRPTEVAICLFSLLKKSQTLLFSLSILSRYRPASRDLKRIGSVSLSPIYAHFSDTLNGIVTIRTMKARLRFLRENEEKINQNQKAQYAGVAAAQWLELRLQLLGCGESWNETWILAIYIELVNTILSCRSGNRNSNNCSHSTPHRRCWSRISWLSHQLCPWHYWKT